MLWNQAKLNELELSLDGLKKEYAKKVWEFLNQKMNVKKTSALQRRWLFTVASEVGLAVASALIDLEWKKANKKK